MVVEKSAPEQIQETHACTDLYSHFWSSALGVHFFVRLLILSMCAFCCCCFCIFVFDGSVFISFTAKISPNGDCIFLSAVSVSVQTLVDARFFCCWFLSLVLSSFFPLWINVDREHECVPRMLFVIYYESHYRRNADFFPLANFGKSVTK